MTKILVSALIIIIVGGVVYVALSKNPQAEEFAFSVVSPNGGEKVMYGETLSIQWIAGQKVADTDAVSIEIGKDGGNYIRIGQTNAEAQVYAWKAVNTNTAAIADAPPQIILTDGQYKIRVQMYENNVPCIGFCPPETEPKLIASDESDESFSIEGASLITLEKELEGLMEAKKTSAN